MWGSALAKLEALGARRSHSAALEFYVEAGQLQQEQGPRPSWRRALDWESFPISTE